jgi:hypothetical protein
MTLPKYKPEGNCPKCGAAGITVQYVANDYEASYRAPKYGGERLLRHCRSCGYEWNEGCLDKEMRP